MSTDRARQAILDEEHLRLLRIGYLCAAGVDLFFALIPLLYIVMGLVFVAVGAPPSARPGDPGPALIGGIFVALGVILGVMTLAMGAAKLYVARAIKRRRSRTLCFVVAGLSCLHVPYGTLLGVATFLVLTRESVKERFDPPNDQIDAPPPRATTFLFSDDEAHR
jgi:hypothetical protein